jgi:hypothetical protein
MHLCGKKMQAMLRLGGNTQYNFKAPAPPGCCVVQRIPRATILTPKKSKNPLTCGRMHAQHTAFRPVRPSATPRAGPRRYYFRSACLYINTQAASATHLLPCSRQQQQTFIFRSSFFLSNRRPADAETRQAEKPTFVHNSFPSVHPLLLLKSTFFWLPAPQINFTLSQII